MVTKARGRPRRSASTSVPATPPTSTPSARSKSVRRAARVEVELQMECLDDDLSPAQLKAFEDATREHEKANELIKKARAGSTLVPTSVPNTFTVVPIKPVAPPTPQPQPQQQAPQRAQTAKRTFRKNTRTPTPPPLASKAPEIATVEPADNHGLPPPRPAQFLNKRTPQNKPDNSKQQVVNMSGDVIILDSPPSASLTSTTITTPTTIMMQQGATPQQVYKLVSVPSSTSQSAVIQNQWAIRPMLTVTPQQQQIRGALRFQVLSGMVPGQAQILAQTAPGQPQLIAQTGPGQATPIQMPFLGQTGPGQARPGQTQMRANVPQPSVVSIFQSGRPVARTEGDGSGQSFNLIGRFGQSCDMIGPNYSSGMSLPRFSALIGQIEQRGQSYSKCLDFIDEYSLNGRSHPKCCILISQKLFNSSEVLEAHSCHCGYHITRRRPTTNLKTNRPLSFQYRRMKILKRQFSKRRLKLLIHGYCNRGSNWCQNDPVITEVDSKQQTNCDTGRTSCAEALVKQSTDHVNLNSQMDDQRIMMDFVPEENVACNSRNSGINTCDSRNSEVNSCDSWNSEINTCVSRNSEVSTCDSRNSEVNACDSRNSEVNTCGSQNSKINSCDSWNSKINICDSQKSVTDNVPSISLSSQVLRNVCEQDGKLSNNHSISANRTATVENQPACKCNCTVINDICKLYSVSHPNCDIPTNLHCEKCAPVICQKETSQKPALGSSAPLRSNSALGTNTPLGYRKENIANIVKKCRQDGYVTVAKQLNIPKTQLMKWSREIKANVKLRVNSIHGDVKQCPTHKQAELNVESGSCPPRDFSIDSEETHSAHQGLESRTVDSDHVSKYPVTELSASLSDLKEFSWIWQDHVKHRQEVIVCIAGVQNTKDPEKLASQPLASKQNTTSTIVPDAADENKENLAAACRITSAGEESTCEVRPHKDRDMSMLWTRDDTGVGRINSDKLNGLDAARKMPDTRPIAMTGTLDLASHSIKHGLSDGVLKAAQNHCSIVASVEPSGRTVDVGDVLENVGACGRQLNKQPADEDMGRSARVRAARKECFKLDSDVDSDEDDLKLYIDVGSCRSGSNSDSPPSSGEKQALSGHGTRTSQQEHTQEAVKKRLNFDRPDKLSTVNLGQDYLTSCDEVDGIQLLSGEKPVTTATTQHWDARQPHNTDTRPVNEPVNGHTEPCLQTSSCTEGRKIAMETNKFIETSSLKSGDSVTVETTETEVSMEREDSSVKDPHTTNSRTGQPSSPTVSRPLLHDSRLQDGPNQLPRLKDMDHIVKQDKVSESPEKCLDLQAAKRSQTNVAMATNTCVVTSNSVNTARNSLPEVSSGGLCLKVHSPEGKCVYYIVSQSERGAPVQSGKPASLSMVNPLQSCAARSLLEQPVMRTAQTSAPTDVAMETPVTQSSTGIAWTSQQHDKTSQPKKEKKVRQQRKPSEGNTEPGSQLLTPETESFKGHVYSDEFLEYVRMNHCTNKLYKQFFIGRASEEIQNTKATIAMNSMFTDKGPVKKTYDLRFKEEVLKLSYKIGIGPTADVLGLFPGTIMGWRKQVLRVLNLSKAQSNTLQKLKKDSSVKITDEDSNVTTMMEHSTLDASNSGTEAVSASSTLMKQNLADTNTVHSTASTEPCSTSTPSTTTVMSSSFRIHRIKQRSRKRVKQVLLSRDLRVKLVALARQNGYKAVCDSYNVNRPSLRRWKQMYSGVRLDSYKITTEDMVELINYSNYLKDLRQKTAAGTHTTSDDNLDKQAPSPTSTNSCGEAVSSRVQDMVVNRTVPATQRKEVDDRCHDNTSVGGMFSYQNLEKGFSDFSSDDEAELIEIGSWTVPEETMATPEPQYDDSRINTPVVTMATPEHRNRIRSEGTPVINVSNSDVTDGQLESDGVAKQSSLQVAKTGRSWEDYNSVFRPIFSAVTSQRSNESDRTKEPSQKRLTPLPMLVQPISIKPEPFDEEFDRIEKGLKIARHRDSTESNGDSEKCNELSGQNSGAYNIANGQLGVGGHADRNGRILGNDMGQDSHRSNIEDFAQNERGPVRESSSASDVPQTVLGLGDRNTGTQSQAAHAFQPASGSTSNSGNSAAGTCHHGDSHQGNVGSSTVCAGAGSGQAEGNPAGYPDIQVVGYSDLEPGHNYYLLDGGKLTPVSTAVSTGHSLTSEVSASSQQRELVPPRSSPVTSPPSPPVTPRSAQLNTWSYRPGDTDITAPPAGTSDLTQASGSSPVAVTSSPTLTTKTSPSTVMPPTLQSMPPRLVIGSTNEMAPLPQSYINTSPVQYITISQAKSSYAPTIIRPADYRTSALPSTSSLTASTTQVLKPKTTKPPEIIYVSPDSSNSSKTPLIFTLPKKDAANHPTILHVEYKNSDPCSGPKFIQLKDISVSQSQAGVKVMKSMIRLPGPLVRPVARSMPASLQSSRKSPISMNPSSISNIASARKSPISMNVSMSSVAAARKSPITMNLSQTSVAVPMTLVENVSHRLANTAVTSSPQQKILVKVSSETSPVMSGSSIASALRAARASDGTKLSPVSPQKTGSYIMQRSTSPYAVPRKPLILVKPETAAAIKRYRTSPTVMDSQDSVTSVSSARFPHSTDQTGSGQTLDLISAAREVMNEKALTLTGDVGSLSSHRLHMSQSDGAIDLSVHVSTAQSNKPEAISHLTKTGHGAGSKSDWLNHPSVSGEQNIRKPVRGKSSAESPAVGSGSGNMNVPDSRKDRKRPRGDDDEETARRKAKEKFLDLSAYVSEDKIDKEKVLLKSLLKKRDELVARLENQTHNPSADKSERRPSTTETVTMDTSIMATSRRHSSGGSGCSDIDLISSTRKQDNKHSSAAITDRDSLTQTAGICEATSVLSRPAGNRINSLIQSVSKRLDTPVAGRGGDDATGTKPATQNLEYKGNSRLDSLIHNMSNRMGANNTPGLGAKPELSNVQSSQLSEPTPGPSTARVDRLMTEAPRSRTANDRIGSLITSMKERIRSGAGALDSLNKDDENNAQPADTASLEKVDTSPACNTEGTEDSGTKDTCSNDLIIETNTQNAEKIMNRTENTRGLVPIVNADRPSMPVEALPLKQPQKDETLLLKKRRKGETKIRRDIRDIRRKGAGKTVEAARTAYENEESVGLGSVDEDDERSNSSTETGVTTVSTRSGVSAGIHTDDDDDDDYDGGKKSEDDRDDCDEIKKNDDDDSGDDQNDLSKKLKSLLNADIFNVIGDDDDNDEHEKSDEDFGILNSKEDGNNKTDNVHKPGPTSSGNIVTMEISDDSDVEKVAPGAGRHSASQRDMVIDLSSPVKGANKAGTIVKQSADVTRAMKSPYLAEALLSTPDPDVRPSRAVIGDHRPAKPSSKVRQKSPQGREQGATARPASSTTAGLTMKRPNIPVSVKRKIGKLATMFSISSLSNKYCLNAGTISKWKKEYCEAPIAGLDLTGEELAILEELKEFKESQLLAPKTTPEKTPPAPVRATPTKVKTTPEIYVDNPEEDDVMIVEDGLSTPARPRPGTVLSPNSEQSNLEQKRSYFSSLLDSKVAEIRPQSSPNKSPVKSDPLKQAKSSKDARSKRPAEILEPGRVPLYINLEEDTDDLTRKQLRDKVKSQPESSPSLLTRNVNVKRSMSNVFDEDQVKTDPSPVARQLSAPGGNTKIGGFIPLDPGQAAPGEKTTVYLCPEEGVFKYRVEKQTTGVNRPSRKRSGTDEPDKQSSRSGHTPSYKKVVVEEARKSGFEKSSKWFNIPITEIMKWHDELIHGKLNEDSKTTIESSFPQITTPGTDTVTAPASQLGRSENDKDQKEVTKKKSAPKINAGLSFERFSAQEGAIMKPRFSASLSSASVARSGPLPGQKQNKTRMGPNTPGFKRELTRASQEQLEKYQADVQGNLGVMPKLVKQTTKSKDDSVEIASTWKQVQSILHPQKPTDKRYTQEFKNKVIRECASKGQKTVSIEHRIPYNEISRWRLEAKKATMALAPRPLAVEKSVDSPAQKRAPAQKKASLAKSVSEPTVSAFEPSSQEVTRPRDSESLKIKIKLSGLGQSRSGGGGQRASRSATLDTAVTKATENMGAPAGADSGALLSSSSSTIIEQLRTPALNVTPSTERYSSKPASPMKKPISPVKKAERNAENFDADAELRLEVINYCYEQGMLKTQKRFNLIRQSIVDLMKEYDDLQKSSAELFNSDDWYKSLKTKLVSREKTSVEDTNAMTPVIVKNLTDYIVTQEYKEGVVEYAKQHGLTATSRKFKRKMTTVRTWVNEVQREEKKKIEQEQMVKEIALLAANMSAEEARKISFFEARKKRLQLENEFKNQYKKSVVDFAKQYGITEATMKFKKKAHTIKSWMGHLAKLDRDARKLEHEAISIQTISSPPGHSQGSFSSPLLPRRQSAPGDISTQTSSQRSPVSAPRSKLHTAPESPLWEQDFVIKPSSSKSPLKMTFSPRRKSSPIIIGSSTEEDDTEKQYEDIENDEYDGDNYDSDDGSGDDDSDDVNDIETEDEEEGRQFVELTSWDLETTSTLKSSKPGLPSQSAPTEGSGSSLKAPVIVVTDDEGHNTSVEQDSTVEYKTASGTDKISEIGSSFEQVSPNKSSHENNTSVASAAEQSSHTALPADEEVVISPTEVPNIFDTDEETLVTTNSTKCGENEISINDDTECVVEAKSEGKDSTEVANETTGNIEERNVDEVVDDGSEKMADESDDEVVEIIPYEETVMFKVLTNEMEEFFNNETAVIERKKLSRRQFSADTEIIANLDKAFLFTGSRAGKTTRQSFNTGKDASEDKSLNKSGDKLKTKENQKSDEKTAVSSKATENVKTSDDSAESAVVKAQNHATDQSKSSSNDIQNQHKDPVFEDDKTTSLPNKVELAEKITPCSVDLTGFRFIESQNISTEENKSPIVSKRSTDKSGTDTEEANKTAEEHPAAEENIEIESSSIETQKRKTNSSTESPQSSSLTTAIQPTADKTETDDTQEAGYKERSLFDILVTSDEKGKTESTTEATQSYGSVAETKEKPQKTPASFCLFGNLMKNLKLPSMQTKPKEPTDGPECTSTDTVKEEVPQQNTENVETEVRNVDKSERNVFDLIAIKGEPTESAECPQAETNKSLFKPAASPPVRNLRSSTKAVTLSSKGPSAANKKPMFKFPKQALSINFGNIAKLGIAKLKEDTKPKSDSRDTSISDARVTSSVTDSSPAKGKSPCQTDKRGSNLFEKLFETGLESTSQPASESIYSNKPLNQQPTEVLEPERNQSDNNTNQKKNVANPKVIENECGKTMDTYSGVVMETFEQLRQRLARERAASKAEKEREKSLERLNQGEPGTDHSVSQTSDTVSEGNDGSKSSVNSVTMETTKSKLSSVESLQKEIVDENKHVSHQRVVDQEKIVSESCTDVGDDHHDNNDDEMYKDFAPEKIVLILDIARKHGIEFASTSFGLPVSVIVNWVIEKDRKHRRVSMSVSLEDQLIALKMLKVEGKSVELVAEECDVKAEVVREWEREVGWLLERKGVVELLDKWNKVETVAALKFEECSLKLQRQESTSEKKVKLASDVESSQVNDQDSETAAVSNQSSNQPIETCDIGKYDNCGTAVEVSSVSGEAGVATEQKSSTDLDTNLPTNIESDIKETVESLVSQVDNNVSQSAPSDIQSCSVNREGSSNEAAKAEDSKVPGILGFAVDNPREFTIEQKAMCVVLANKFGLQRVSKKLGISDMTLSRWVNKKTVISDFLEEQTAGFRLVKKSDESAVIDGNVTEVQYQAAKNRSTQAKGEDKVEPKAPAPAKPRASKTVSKDSESYRMISPTKLPALLRNAKKMATRDYTLEQRVEIVRLVELYGVRQVHKQFRIPTGSIWNWQNNKTVRDEMKKLKHGPARKTRASVRNVVKSLGFESDGKNKGAAKPKRQDENKGDNDGDGDDDNGGEEDDEDGNISIDIILDRVLVNAERNTEFLSFSQQEKADIVCLIHHFGIDYVCEKVPGVPRGTLWNWRHSRHVLPLVTDLEEHLKQSLEKLGGNVVGSVVTEKVDKTGMTQQWLKDCQDSRRRMKRPGQRARDESVDSVKRQKLDSSEQEAPCNAGSEFAGSQTDTSSECSDISLHSGDYEELESDSELTSPSVVSKRSAASNQTAQSGSVTAGTGACTAQTGAPSTQAASTAQTGATKAASTTASGTSTPVRKKGQKVSTPKRSKAGAQSSNPTATTSVDCVTAGKSQDGKQAEEEKEPVYDIQKIEWGQDNRMMVTYSVTNEEAGRPLEAGQKRPLSDMGTAGQPPKKKLVPLKPLNPNSVVDEAGNVVPMDEYFYGTVEGDPSYTEEKGEFRFKCWYCSKMLYNNVRAMQHIQGHIDSSKQQNLDLSDLTQCKHCYKQFDTPFEMQTHVEKVHLSNKVLMCRICEKDFSSMRDLAQHMKGNHHAHEMPYRCNLCNFKSSMYSDVVDHFKKKHDSSNHLLCFYCLRTFEVKFVSQGWGQTQTYYGHLLKHQSRTATKKCTVCRLTFFNTMDVKNHRKLCHVSANTTMTGFSPGGKSGGGPRSKQGASLKSLNAPSITKILDYGDIRFPAATHSAKCIECRMVMSSTDHYKKFIHCSMCRFATSCSVAYANHMMGFHSGQMSSLNLNIPWERPRTQPFYCNCGYSSRYGNKIANHLVGCSKQTCFTRKPDKVTEGGVKPTTKVSEGSKKSEGSLLGMLGLVQKKTVTTRVRSTPRKTPSPTPAASAEIKTNLKTTATILKEKKEPKVDSVEPKDEGNEPKREIKQKMKIEPKEIKTAVKDDDEIKAVKSVDQDVVIEIKDRDEESKLESSKADDELKSEIKETLKPDADSEPTRKDTSEEGNKNDVMLTETDENRSTSPTESQDKEVINVPDTENSSAEPASKEQGSTIDIDAEPDVNVEGIDRQQAIIDGYKMEEDQDKDRKEADSEDVTMEQTAKDEPSTAEETDNALDTTADSETIADSGTADEKMEEDEVKDAMATELTNAEKNEEVDEAGDDFKESDTVEVMKGTDEIVEKSEDVKDEGTEQDKKTATDADHSEAKMETELNQNKTPAEEAKKEETSKEAGEEEDQAAGQREETKDTKLTDQSGSRSEDTDQSGKKSLEGSQSDRRSSGTNQSERRSEERSGQSGSSSQRSRQYSGEAEHSRDRHSSSSERSTSGSHSYHGNDPSRHRSDERSRHDDRYRHDNRHQGSSHRSDGHHGNRSNYDHHRDRDRSHDRDYNRGRDYQRHGGDRSGGGGNYGYQGGQHGGSGYHGYQGHHSNQGGGGYHGGGQRGHHRDNQQGHRNYNQRGGYNQNYRGNYRGGYY